MTTSDSGKQLPRVLDITKAQELLTEMLEGVRHGPMVVDVSEVERVSTPCLQVLLAAGLACDATGSAFRIRNPSETFATALADLGLQSEFSKWMM